MNVPAKSINAGRSRAPAAEARRVRALRPAKSQVDPWRPIASLVESERLVDGRTAPTVTVFLAGAECPFTCVFCDLWRHTLEHPTPVGALPAQLRIALAETASELPAERYSDTWLKLYNASNFFDPRAVPTADLDELAELSSPFGRLVVECHPKLVGEECFQLGARLDKRLQVAMGLETVHPEASRRLGKHSTPEDFAAAAEALRARDLGVRAFVLVGALFLPREETIEWAVRSAAYAWQAGAEHVTLIPLRQGNGELDRLAAAGEFQPPRLSDLEAALARSLERSPRHTVVTADLWDLELLATCQQCFAARQQRLEHANTTGQWCRLPACDHCGDLTGELAGDVAPSEDVAR